MKVAQRHAVDQFADSRLLFRPIESPIAIPLVDDVVELRVEPPRELGVAAEGIDGAVVVPAPVHVASAAFVAPDVPELRVDHRLVRLSVARLEVPRRAGERAVARHAQLLIPLPAGEVVVPRVDVGDGMAPAAAGGVVLDEACGIERLRQPHRLDDALLGGGQISFLAIHLRHEAPRLVVHDPREHGRMVVVAGDHLAQGIVMLAEGRVGRRTPPVGHVGHDQHAELVGPVELARCLDLDVFAQSVQTDLPRAQNFAPREGIGGKGVEARGVIGLVERQLQVDGHVVDRDIGDARSGKIHHRDLSHSEVRLERVGRHAIAGHCRGDFVQKGIAEGPEPRTGQGDLKAHIPRASGDALTHHRCTGAIGERQSQCEIHWRGVGEPGLNRYASPIISPSMVCACTIGSRRSTTRHAR